MDQYHGDDKKYTYTSCFNLGSKGVLVVQDEVQLWHHGSQSPSDWLRVLRPLSIGGTRTTYTLRILFQYPSRVTNRCRSPVLPISSITRTTMRCWWLLLRCAFIYQRASIIERGVNPCNVSLYRQYYYLHFYHFRYGYRSSFPEFSHILLIIRTIRLLISCFTTNLLLTDTPLLTTTAPPL
jgi:hypothetical protein